MLDHNIEIIASLEQVTPISWSKHHHHFILLTLGIGIFFYVSVKKILYHIRDFLCFSILKECSGILWATVIFDRNLMHLSLIHMCFWTTLIKHISFITIRILYSRWMYLISSLHVYIYICMYINARIYIYVYTYICMYIYIYI
jgi:hypothetical protein